MESTGGLADGNTYIGDINLKSETAYQADLGLTYQSSEFMIAPHVFYQNIGLQKMSKNSEELGNNPIKKLLIKQAVPGIMRFQMRRLMLFLII